MNDNIDAFFLKEDDIALDSELKYQVLERDNYTCRYCGACNNLHIHHIVYRSHGGTNDPANLITLCWRCHGDIHLGKRNLCCYVDKEIISHKDLTHLSNSLDKLRRGAIIFEGTLAHRLALRRIWKKKIC